MCGRDSPPSQAHLPRQRVAERRHAGQLFPRLRHSSLEFARLLPLHSGNALAQAGAAKIADWVIILALPALGLSKQTAVALRVPW